MTVWFTSDEHHGHENIIKYCGRPFKNAEHMMNTIIENHNRVVQPTDIVFHLGDLSMRGSDSVPFYRKFMKRYAVAKERHLILGNHDSLSPWTYIDIGFTSVHTSMKIGNWLMAHDPCVFQSGAGVDRMLCGHVHELWNNLMGLGKKVINVGVDQWGFSPVSLERLEEVFNGTNDNQM